MTTPTLREQCLIPVADLVPYARNARTHSAAQVAQLAASIREFGWTNPVLIDEAGGIIAGHGRVLAARELGMQAVPCLRLTGLTEAQKRAYVLADNQLALNAGWDDALLAEELAALGAMEFDLGVLGFASAEVDRLLAGIEAPADEAAADAVPDLRADAVTQPGDLWLLGEHRVLCGDSTRAQDVQRLMGGDRAHLLFTSPSYANQRAYSTGGIKDWDSLMQGVFGAAGGALREDAQVLVNLGLVHRDEEWLPYWDAWIEWMRNQGWRRFGWYVWDQVSVLPGDRHGRLAPRHEFIFHFNRQVRRPNKIVPNVMAGVVPTGNGMRSHNGDVRQWTHSGKTVQAFRIPDSVIQVMRQHGSIGDDLDHPAVFPLGLPKFLMEAYSDPGDIAFEPFAGSGTAVIAGHVTDRRVRGMELSPHYVDVIVRRWQAYTGQRAVHAETGAPFPA